MAIFHVTFLGNHGFRPFSRLIHLIMTRNIDALCYTQMVPKCLMNEVLNATFVKRPLGSESGFTCSNFSIERFGSEVLYRTLTTFETKL